jgi:hypothetical protein
MKVECNTFAASQSALSQILKDPPEIQSSMESDGEERDQGLASTESTPSVEEKVSSKIARPDGRICSSASAFRLLRMWQFWIKVLLLRCTHNAAGACCDANKSKNGPVRMLLEMALRL